MTAVAAAIVAIAAIAAAASDASTIADRSGFLPSSMARKAVPWPADKDEQM